MASIRRERGMLFLLSARAFFLLVLLAPWLVPWRGWTVYLQLCAFFGLLALITSRTKKKEENPYLEEGEELRGVHPMRLVIFHNTSEDEPRTTYSDCVLHITDRRLLLFEEPRGQDSHLLAVIALSQEHLPPGIPALRTWAAFVLNAKRTEGRALILAVEGENDLSGHWAVRSVELVANNHKELFAQMLSESHE